MSGGEKYMLSLALALSDDHNVSLFWDGQDKEAITTMAKTRFGFDLGKITFVPDIFSKDVSFVTKVSESRKYDLIIYLSDGSIPVVACPLMLHFQSPVEWVNGRSVKNRIKLLRTKKVICNSYFTKFFIDRKFGIRSTVVYPPVDVPSLQKTDKENIILNVGRFGINTAGSSYKKQDMLAKTFNKMIAEGLRDWKLVLVMSVKEEDQKALTLFQKQFESKAIQFVINPTREKLWEFYGRAKIYWHASGFGEDLEKHPDRAEHFGISTVEAMSMGAVPVVINAGGQKEIVTNDKTGFLWDSAQELEKYTGDLIKHNSLRARLSLEASKRAQDFAYDHFQKAIKDAIK